MSDPYLDPDGTPRTTTYDRGESTGLWHIVVSINGEFVPSTVFRRKSGRSELYADEWMPPGSYICRLEILHAPDEAVAALRQAGYQFDDRR